MPLPAALLRVVHEPRFWTDAWFITSNAASRPELRDCKIRLPVTRRHTIALGMDEHLFQCTLGLSIDGAPPVELGWDDEAHWHPHVLRWEEVDRIGKAVTTRDPDLPHPGLVVLLLARFAPVTDDADARVALSLLDAAWSQLGLFPTRASRLPFFDRIDARGAGFRWRLGPNGRVIEQPVGDGSTSSSDPLARLLNAARLGRALYTLRDEANGDFPFEEFEAMIAACPPAASQVVEIPVPAPTVQVEVQFTVSASLPPEGIRFATTFLDRALQERSLGSASVFAAGDDSARVKARVRRPGAEVKELVGGLLARAGLGGSTTIDGAPIPPWTEPPFETRYVQCFDFRVTRWAPGRVRFDRVPFDGDKRAAITATLDALGFSPEDDDGVRWLRAEGGAQIGARFPGLSDGRRAEGGSLTFDNLSLDVAAVVHTLLREARLFLYPPLVAPFPDMGAAIDTPWPGNHLAPDPATLHMLLSRSGIPPAAE